MLDFNQTIPYAWPNSPKFPKSPRDSSNRYDIRKAVSLPWAQ